MKKTNVVPLRPLNLLNYDAACQALAKAVNFDDVKGILDLAERMKLYGKQAKDPQAIRDAVALRERAEYELGMLMKAQAETVGLAKGAKGIGTSAGYKKTRTPDTPATFAEIGIDKNLAHRARKRAAARKAMAGIEERRQGIYPPPNPRRVMVHDVVDISDDAGLSFDYDIEQALHAARDEREGLVVSDDVLAKVRAVINAWKQCLKRLEESHGRH